MVQIRLPSLIRILEPIFYGDSVYKFKRIVGKPNFSDQFKKIIKRYIKDITWMSCDSLHAWFKTQSRFIALDSSLIAGRWVRPQTI